MRGRGEIEPGTTRLEGQHALARRGCHLSLVDISEPGLAETVQLVDGASIRISRHRLGVADRAAVATLPQAVVAEHCRIDLMFNNRRGFFEAVAQIVVGKRREDQARNGYVLLVRGTREIRGIGANIQLIVCAHRIMQRTEIERRERANSGARASQILLVLEEADAR